MEPDYEARLVYKGNTEQKDSKDLKFKFLFPNIDTSIQSNSSVN